MADGTKDAQGNAVYAWLARTNTPEDCVCKDPLNTDPDMNDADRMVGIDLHFKNNNKVKHPIKLVEVPCGYESVSGSEDCPDQGYFYADCVECGSEEEYCDDRCHSCYEEYIEREEQEWEEEHTCPECGTVDEAISCYDPCANCEEDGE
jgi:hypothetical protein